MIKEIKCSKLILVEGDHEKRFLRVILNKLAYRGDDIQIEYVEGKNNFSNIISAISLITGFDKVKLLAVIRDADDNAHGAFISIKNILAANSFSVPDVPGHLSNGNPKTGIFILPENGKNGMLDDLFLSSQSDHPVMECVESFIQCVATKVKSEDMPTNLSKAKTQVFLGAMPKTIYNVGIAAEIGYWNLEKDCLDDLITFLNLIISS